MQTNLSTWSKQRENLETEALGDLANPPCYAARLVRPLFSVLGNERRLAPETSAWVFELDSEERIPISTVHKLLRRALESQRDDTIGVRAARQLALGDYGALDYAMSSAESLRAAIDTAGRYTRLVNDALVLSLEVRDERAIVRMESRTPVPRAAMDFQLCGLIWNQARVWPEGLSGDLDVWFPYSAPEHLDEHRQTLGSARLHFDAPYAGFSFPARLLECPLRTTDSTLHYILRRHAENEMAALPRTKSLSERVRELVMAELVSGNPSSARISRRLDLSRRTLNRRLGQEGTTFRALLDDARKQLGLQYVSQRGLVISEIAVLTGFSESASFTRAFQRWTGQTPSEYRRERRGA